MKDIFMIGNTHYDPVWLWRWDEALSSITATFRSALQRMEETPDFCYSFSAPAVLEQIEKTNPALFCEIKQRVAEGRWDLAEGWWLQADTNAASGESYVRQGLYGQRYLLQKFGKMSRAAFNIDSFGHCSNLPQILAGCGIEFYCFWRPNQVQYELNAPLFVWEGGAGKSVLAYRVGGDGGEIFTEHFEEDTLKKVAENPDGQDLLVVFGVTDHGGAPTKEAISKIEQYRVTYQDKVQFRFGTVEDYFDRQKGKDLGRIKGEIQVTFIGPYSNFTEIKKNNRLAEYGALNAEKASVLAEKLVGMEYPAEKLRKSWQDILFNQFHDILGGACIEDAYFDARNLHGRSLQTTNEIVTFALQAMTNNIKMPGKNPDNEWNLVVWNLNCAAFCGAIEAEVQWAWEFPWYEGGIELIDELGEKIPCQIIREKSVVPGFRSRFAFTAEIPALGYRSFIVKKTNNPCGHIIPKPVIGAEHGRFRVDVSSGAPALYENGQLLTECFLRPYAIEDQCDTWGFNKTVYEDKKQYLTLESAEITEDGLCLTKLKTTWRFGHSVAEVYYTLYNEHIDCDYRVLWQEKGFALKLELQGRSNNLRCFASSPYGCEARLASEFEKPVGEHISLISENSGFYVAMDSIFAYHFSGSSIGLTLLRNCIFGDLRTRELEKADYRYMGQGETKGRLRVFTQRPKNLTAEATAFNNPPRVLLEANHAGTLKSCDGFFNCDNDALYTTVVKKQEDNDKLVVRSFNPDKDAPQSGTVTLFGKSISVSLLPEEIKTLTEDSEGFHESSMLEED